MISTLEKRLIALESRVKDSGIIHPAIVIHCVNASKDAVPDESKIVEYSDTDGEIYTILPGETDVDFLARSTTSARLKLGKGGIPCLIARLQNQILVSTKLTV